MAQEHHYIKYQAPIIQSHFSNFIFRRTKWRVPNRDGSVGSFTSIWLFSHLQWYYGSAKCDGTESYKLGAPVSNTYDYTDEASELRAFRWRSKAPLLPVWDNMGGT